MTPNLRATPNPPTAIDWRARRHPAWWAALVHRLSGVLLTLFLPAHFWALSLAIQGEARLDRFLRWTQNPHVRLGETLLILLLAAHLAGGIRILALEFLDLRQGQKTAIALSAGFSFAVGLAYLLEAF
jgi:fumarate reductase subunit D